jgi:Cu-Zn family superoxide dismutase
MALHGSLTKGAAAGAVAALVATAPGGAALAQGVGASATLMDSSGRTVGTAQFTQLAGGVRITLSASNLPPGPHGIHLHEVGVCDAPAFMGAGAHFNPTNRQHGLSNPLGPHAGDLPELTVASNGTASYATTNSMVSLGTGPESLLDANGSALVIHADADDQMTDPSGNTGARIACGVLVRGAAALPATGGGAGAATWLPAALAALTALLLAAGALLGPAARAGRRLAWHVWR